MRTFLLYLSGSCERNLEKLFNLPVRWQNQEDLSETDVQDREKRLLMTQGGGGEKGGDRCCIIEYRKRTKVFIATLGERSDQ